MFEVRETTVFEGWLLALRDRRAKSLVAARIGRLRFGHFGDARPVGDGISEVRIHLGPGYRVYFTRRGQTIILLLCGGDKGTQARDIITAKSLAANLED